MPPPAWRHSTSVLVLATFKVVSQGVHRDGRGPVRPANIKRSLAELRDDLLAEFKSIKGPYASRLRTWNQIAFKGSVAP